MLRRRAIHLDLDTRIWKAVGDFSNKFESELGFTGSAHAIDGDDRCACLDPAVKLVAFLFASDEIGDRGWDLIKGGVRGRRGLLDGRLDKSVATRVYALRRDQDPRADGSVRSGG